MKRFLCVGLFAGLLGLAQPASAAEPAAGEVNIYTARHYDADRKLYELFTQQTGIKVSRIEGNADQLIARMKSEGAGSPADVLLMADAGALWRAQQAGLFQAAKSEALDKAIPADLRDPDGNWFGFSRRARIVAYDTKKVRPEEVADYAAVATPRFRGKLCVRSADSVYNLSLVGSLIEAWGVDKTKEWVRGVVANMARPPKGGDRDQIRAVGAGVCEIALTNSYYYIRLATGDDAKDKAITEHVKLAFASVDDKGAHVNVSGGGVAAHAPHRDNAVRFLEFLASPEAQAIIASANNEFPASNGVAPPPPVDAYADFKAMPMPVARYGPRQAEAQSMMSEAGWR